MPSLTNARFRELIIGAAAACHGDREEVRAQLDALEADARRWRAQRRAFVALDPKFFELMASQEPKDPEHPTPEEVDAAADYAVSQM